MSDQPDSPKRRALLAALAGAPVLLIDPIKGELVPVDQVTDSTIVLAGDGQFGKSVLELYDIDRYQREINKAFGLNLDYMLGTSKKIAGNDCPWYPVCKHPFNECRCKLPTPFHVEPS